MAKDRKKQCDDDSGNSEESLIKLIREILNGVVRSVTGALSELRDRLTASQTKEDERHRQIMTALETLTASIDANTAGQADLTTVVNEAITRIGTPSVTDAQLLSLAGLVDSSTASDAALAAALRAALGTPAPTPAPTPVP